VIIIAFGGIRQANNSRAQIASCLITAVSHHPMRAFAERPVGLDGWSRRRVPRIFDFSWRVLDLI
jgi:hypothetical protein